MNEHPDTVIMGPMDPSAFKGVFSKSDQAKIPEGGRGPALINLVEARIQAGLKTEIITLAAGLDRPWMEFVSDSLRMWVVRRRSRHVLRDFFRVEREWMNTVLRRTDAECIHAHWSYEYAWAALDHVQKPTVITLHDHAGRLARYQGLHRLVFSKMARRVFSSPALLTAVAPHVQRYAEAKSGKVVPMIPNVLGQSVRGREPEFKRRTENHYLIFLGGWSRLKNTRNLLRAFHEFHHQLPGVRLVLLGAGCEEGGEAFQWARKRKLDENVDFAGCQPYSRAVELIADATALVHPSWEEACPMPILEALALGVPVVGNSKCTASEWLLDHGQLGMLVDGGSVSDLARGMINAVNPPRGILMKARKHVLEMTSPEFVIHSYDHVYREAISAS